MAQSDTYLDPAAPIDDRVNDLLARLSVQEKAGQLTQYFYLRSMHPASDGADPADLPTEHRRPPSQPAMVEAEIRAGRAGSVLFVRDPATRNELQRLAVEHGPHRIPLIFGYDVIHGLRTIMPVPIAMAASWDPAVLEAAQASAAEQARAVGISWTFAPMVDIARDPRWGRIVEGAGEDPYLGAACAAAQVRGFQGGPDIGREGRVLAGPKHFAGYGAARGGRDYEDSEISDNELWNVYLPPFKAAVDAGAGNVMSAYMDLCGVPACGNRWLLTDVLRGTFGFEGFVVSDADAVQSLTTQHFAEDLTDAGARALMAGLDMEMGRDDAAYKRLPEALGAGLITVEALDTAVRRVLRAKFAMGLFENPYVDVEAAPAVLADPAHRRVARTAAESTLVLLKNRPGPDGSRVLPLGARGSIAVVGQLADSPRDTLGPWVFDYDPAEVTTILAGIRERAGSDVRVDYAVGEWAPPRRFPSMFDEQEPAGSLPVRPDDFDDEAAIDEAVRLASGAGVAVVVVGQAQNCIGEKASVSTLELPGHQLDLLTAVAATGTPTVALVMSGRPLDMRWADENLPAIMQVWYPGTCGGRAVAAALFGDVDPAGRLPFTWPRTVGQVPMIYSHDRTFQPEGAGERYWDEESTPLYPFGHGGSYTSFEYSRPRVSAQTIAVGEAVSVDVDVTNTGARDGEEVVQLYIHQRHGRSSRPVRELKGFRRVAVPAGRTITVEFGLGPDELSYWSAASRTHVQDSSTTVDVYVGGSSLAEATTSFEVR
ncbi:glycoside hydrolase family 3 N-terminal domain-containing protein [Actinomyces sp. oral taxon 448]|uniref:glycoside hydrolase family 3 N-terminal domain-containing protein n=1 Tax=Actinomyces sp. oral taxon 448 TaxID=712124 RepID=UPI0002189080|nr:glycoside hydrolase family 3 N-terminal domain-containing protein [Actinomyces sp. oral taxon 448]EGQ73959.1 beta-glucosidase [Actinomyces sp. oral taxon 448 str. F0400]